MAVTLLAAFALLAGVAWACVPQPQVSLVPRASGAPGARVTVDVIAVPGPAEVRWNTLDGPVLARATGPNFSADITVPDVGGGLYAIVVIGRGPDGGVASTGRSAVLVTGPGAAPPIAAPPARPVSASSGRTSGLLLLVGGTGVAALGGAVGSILTTRRRPVTTEAGHDTSAPSL